MTHNTFAESILRFLFPWDKDSLARQAAGQIARQCRDGLVRRVYPRTANMSMAEVRGYLRAHATGCVVAEVDRAVQNGRLQLALHKRVTQHAIDQLVAAVAHDVFCDEALSLGVRTMAA